LVAERDVRPGRQGDLHVVSSEHLKGREADGQRSELAGDLAAVWRGQWRCRRRIVHGACPVHGVRRLAVPAGQPNHRARRLDELGGGAAQAGKLQTVHGLDSPHGKQPLAIQIQKGWFAPDGHSFKDRLHHLFQAAEPLVIALLAQIAVECDLGNASAS
jgi:hypothetical protein